MTGLAIRAAAAVRAPKGRGWADDQATLGYFQDLLGPFGAEPDKELLHRGAHVHHEDLVDLLADADGVRDSRPQLLIVAHALPDVVPFTAVAPYFTAKLGVEATCFAIAQQGLAAPFTALRIASAYQRSGRASQVVLAVLEQTTLPTAFSPAGGGTPTDSAAALVLSAGPAQGSGPRLVRVAAGERLDAWLAAGSGSGSGYGSQSGPGGGPGTLVVLGAGAPQRAPAGVDVHRAAAGGYCTGVWLELAENWADWQARYDRIVLCDTDPGTGRSQLAEFGGGPGSGSGPAAEGRR